MAGKKFESKKEAELPVRDYRNRRAKRKNIPPAGLVARGQYRETPPIDYSYNPHLLG